MALHIKALSGPHKDRSFSLRNGFVIGRSEGDMIIASDAKLSSRHAYVEMDQNGHLYLVDNGSKNGLRVDQTPVERIKLVVGLRILIGTHQYEVVRDAVGAQATAPSSKSKARYWHEVLIDYAKRCLGHIDNEPRAIVPLQPAVVLDFVRGGQAETRWVLGYGPRKVGAGSVDLPIFEADAPKICFEILPTPDGISFKTNYPDVVKLNGNSVEAEVLHVADVIKIHGTEIEVDFIE